MELIDLEEDGFAQETISDDEDVTREHLEAELEDDSEEDNDNLSTLSSSSVGSARNILQHYNIEDNDEDMVRDQCHIVILTLLLYYKAKCAK